MKIKELIHLYEQDEIGFTFFADLITVEDILFDKKEIQQLHEFYDKEFDNFFNSN